MVKGKWGDIIGYENYYQISNLGNVRSLDRKIHFNKGISIKKGQLLKPVLTRKDYLKVALSKESKEKRFYIHRLVAEAFIPNHENKPQINHINGNKLDNTVENLEWCTNFENQRHAIKYGLVNQKRRINQAIKMGEINKKPLEQYTKQNKFIRKFNSIKEASIITGINSRNICNCLSENQPKSKSAGGYIWKYVKGIN